MEYRFNLKDPNSKLVRWRLSLEEFDYEIRYKPGKQNADLVQETLFQTLKFEIGKDFD